MIDFLGKALEWLKSPKRWAALFVVCVVLLVLPRRAAEWMRLTAFRDHYLQWISLCGLVSLAVLVVEFAGWLRTPLNSFRERRQRKALLLSLTPPEMKIIATYFVLTTDSLEFSATDGLAGGLVAKNLIYRTTTVSIASVPKFAYNLQPWVRETFRKNPGMLQAFMVIANRK